MDIGGILKDAWRVTWRHKALWILGLFAGGSAGVSTANWQLDSSDFQGGTVDTSNWVWGTNEFRDKDVEHLVNEVRRFFESGAVPEWLPWLLGGIALLVLLGVLLWVLSVAARGGLISQADVALSGGEVSVKAGWRTGFRRWGRVFAVGFLLAVPVIVFGAVNMAAFVALGVTFFANGEQITPGLLGLGVLVPLALLLGIALSVLLGLLREVSYRHAVLADRGAVDSIKAAWEDLVGKRGVVTMWLVMLVVGIGTVVASAIMMIPLVIAVVLFVGAAVAGAGLSGLWMLLPLGLLLIAAGLILKSVYTTFESAAWTEFFRRMTGSAGTPVVAAPVAAESGGTADGV